MSFFRNIELDPNRGCWNWTACKTADGYGWMRFRGRSERVHRISAHIYSGYDLNSPLQVLHSCDNPSCFNPRHLSVGTSLDNMRDAKSKRRFANQKKTHCSSGHLYAGDNLYVMPSGERRCKACRATSSLKWYLAKKSDRGENKL
jgi:hypothetical protein